MTRTTSPSNLPSDPAVACALALERVLAALIEQHDRLLACIERKQEGIRTAQMETISQALGEEKAIIEQITQQESQRSQIAWRLAEELGLAQRQSITVSDLAEALADQEAADRIRTLARELREKVTIVRRRSSLVRQAAETLAAHLNGVMQSVHAALGRAGVYGHRGRIDTRAQIEFSVDVKT